MELAYIETKSLPLQDIGLPTAWHRNTPLFKLDDALIFLDYCFSHDITVLGYDSFIIDGEYITPDMQYIEDFSSLLTKGFANNADNYQLIKSIILALPSYLYLEFSLCKILEANP